MVTFQSIKPFGTQALRCFICSNHTNIPDESLKALLESITVQKRAKIRKKYALVDPEEQTVACKSFDEAKHEEIERFS